VCLCVCLFECACLWEMGLSGLGLVATGTSGVLRGVNVLMVAMGLPGECAGWRLAQYGARVTRIEPEVAGEGGGCDGGDEAEGATPPSLMSGARVGAGAGLAAVSEDPLSVWCPQAYEDLAEGQRLVRARLQCEGVGEGEGGRSSAVLERLLSESDVLVEALRPATREAAGLGREALESRHPRLGVVRLVGPRPEAEAGWRLPGRSDAEVGVWTSAGLMRASEPSGMMPPVLLSDMAGGLMLTEAALAVALAPRRPHPPPHPPPQDPGRGGGGGFLEVSLEGAGRWMALPQVPWGMTDPVSGCHGGAHAGYRVYRTLDGRQVAWSALDHESALQLASAAQCALPGTLLEARGAEPLKVRVFKHMHHAHTHRAIQAFCETRTARELCRFAAQEGLDLHVLPRRP